MHITDHVPRIQRILSGEKLLAIPLLVADGAHCEAQRTVVLASSHNPGPPLPLTLIHSHDTFPSAYRFLLLCARLRPLIEELKSVRKECMEVDAEYQQKKGSHEKVPTISVPPTRLPS